MHKIQQRLAAEEAVAKLLAEADNKMPALERAQKESTQSLQLQQDSNHRSPYSMNGSQFSRGRQSPKSPLSPIGTRPSTSLEIKKPTTATAVQWVSLPPERSHTSLGTLDKTGESLRNPMRYSQRNRESTLILKSLAKSMSHEDEERRKYSPTKKGDGKSHQTVTMGMITASLWSGYSPTRSSEVSLGSTIQHSAVAAQHSNRDTMTVGGGTVGMGLMGERMAVKLQSLDRKAFLEAHPKNPSPLRSPSPISPEQAKERLTFAQMKVQREVKQHQQAQLVREQRARDELAREEVREIIGDELKASRASAQADRDQLRAAKRRRIARVAESRANDKVIEEAKKEQLYEYQDEQLHEVLMKRAIRREGRVAEEHNRVQSVMKHLSDNKTAADALRKASKRAKLVRERFDKRFDALQEATIKGEKAHTISAKKARESESQIRNAQLIQASRAKAAEDKLIIEQHRYEYQVMMRARTGKGLEDLGPEPMAQSMPKVTEDERGV